MHSYPRDNREDGGHGVIHPRDRKGEEVRGMSKMGGWENERGKTTLELLDHLDTVVHRQDSPITIPPDLLRMCTLLLYSCWIYMRLLFIRVLKLLFPAQLRLQMNRIYDARGQIMVWLRERNFVPKIQYNLPSTFSGFGRIIKVGHIATINYFIQKLIAPSPSVKLPPEFMLMKYVTTTKIPKVQISS